MYKRSTCTYTVFLQTRRVRQSVDQDLTIVSKKSVFRDLKSAISITDYFENTTLISNIFFQSEDPLGRKRWVSYDQFCDQAEGVQIQLTLTKCNENEFTCDDGSCQALDFRCDMKPDCEDKSDENFCNTITIPSISKNSYFCKNDQSNSTFNLLTKKSEF